MKKFLVSTQHIRAWGIAVLLVCLIFPTCDLLEEEDTCQYTTEESKVWTPTEGIIGFAPLPSLNYSIWDADLSGGDNLYNIENVCPHAEMTLHLTIKETTALSEYHAISYEALIAYSYGEKFSTYESYPFYRTNETTVERNVVVIPDVLGIVQKATTVSVVVRAKVPYAGNEDLAEGIQWINNYLTSITIEASFTKYR